jgi:putative transposase
MKKVAQGEVLQKGWSMGQSLSLDELAREGARKMIEAALFAEVEDYLERHKEARDGVGHALVVGNGSARPRPFTVGSGTVEIVALRVNDKRVIDGERMKFTSKVLPPYMRRSPQVSEVLPILYLRGLSTGDFREALPVLLGEEAAGLSPSAISRLTTVWQEEYRSWNERSLADRDYVYIWADGVHFNVRLEDERLACLVVIGARPDGTKEVIALEDGYRESTESWKSLLRRLKKRGMRAPVVAVGDGALGFWGALRDVWPLGARDSQRARQAAQGPSAEGEVETSRSDERAGQVDLREAHPGVRGAIRSEVSEGRRIPHRERGETPNAL